MTKKIFVVINFKSLKVNLSAPRPKGRGRSTELSALSMSKGLRGTFRSGMNLSILLSILCAVAWGVQAIFLKIAMKNISVYGAILVSLAVNWLVIVGALFLRGQQGVSEFYSLSWNIYLYFMIAGILNYLLGRGFYYSSFRFIGVTQATSISATYPILSAGFAIIFLTEKLALRQYFGVALTLIGIYLVILKGKK